MYLVPERQNNYIGDFKMIITLISCTAKKKDYPCKASEMYSESPRFSLAYRYAKEVSDAVYILSAKYGLISEYDLIEPYNETLKQKSKSDRRKWSFEVINLLKNKHSLNSDKFIIIAGKAYNEFLLPELNLFELPLEGLSLGKWIPKLKELISVEMPANKDKSKCVLIHELMTGLPRYDWGNIKSIPFYNGIYIMFESGEKFCGMDRIVRIGTHRSDGRLIKRLENHFINENKDASILRKNVGLSLLRKKQHGFESIWALDWSNPEIRRKVSCEKNLKTKKEIEGLVSSYMRENIQFTCIRVDDRKDRLIIENALISTLNGSEDFNSSQNWLGRYNPKQEISSSGLWNTQGLKGNGFSDSEFKDFISFVLNGTPILREKEKTIKQPMEKVRKAKKSSNKYASKQSGKIGTYDIKDYIQKIIEKSRNDGLDYIDIVSGQIHKQMGLKKSMPLGCGAMYKLMNEDDIIIHTTPSGKSSTIKIRYFLSR